MKDKKILYGIIITFIFLLSVGLTYAYFTTVEVGQGSNVTASVGTLSILYTDGPEIKASSIQPGWTTTKTVIVKNTGTLKAYYSLVWLSLTNEITNDELILSATCTSDIGSCDGINSQAVNINEAVAYGRPLLQNEEHTYVITFLFKETGSAQNYNQDKKFNGVLNVIDAIESNTIVGQLLDSNGNPINGATVEMHSTLRTGKTDSNGHFEIRGVEIGNHEITVKNSSNTTIASDSLSIASGSSLEVNNKNITGITDKGLINTSIKLSATNTIEEIKVYPSLKDKILSDNTVYADNVSSPYVTSASGIDFKAKSTLTNGQGLYKNSKLEDGKNTYFRGGSYCAYTDYTLEDLTGTKCTAAGGTWSSYNCNLNTNRTTCASKGFTYYDLKNNVTFAGHKWKIIRIDENNNIRMILADDSVSNSQFNSNYNDNAHVGYMYGNSTLFQETTTGTTTSIDIGTTNTYYYGTTYAKNGSNQYYLTGTMISGIWNTAGVCVSGSCPVANYYTCKSTSSSGTCSTLYKITSWNSATNANAYTTTYASQSYNQAHTNTNNSTIKTATDSWYSTNMINYTNYLTDAGYCSDRSLTSGLGYGVNSTNYKGYTRNYPDSTASPRLSSSANCSNPTRDLFTTKNSTTGNKMLTYPVGLITTDEVRYAGMVYYGTTSTQYNFTNYLKFNGWYWTMSPMFYYSSSSVASVYLVTPHGNFSSNYVYNTVGLRASVSLKSSTSVMSGLGTYDDPYVIQ